MATTEKPTDPVAEQPSDDSHDERGEQKRDESGEAAALGVDPPLTLGALPRTAAGPFALLLFTLALAVGAVVFEERMPWGAIGT